MEISLEQQDGEWYNSLPHRGEVYDLIYTAMSGTGTADRLQAVVALGKSGDPRAVRPLVTCSAMQMRRSGYLQQRLLAA